VAACRSRHGSGDGTLAITEVRAGETVALRVGKFRRPKTERTESDRESKRVWLRPTRFHGFGFVAPSLLRGETEEAEFLFARASHRRRGELRITCSGRFQLGTIRWIADPGRRPDGFTSIENGNLRLLLAHGLDNLLEWHGVPEGAVSWGYVTDPNWRADLVRARASHSVDPLLGIQLVGRWKWKQARWFEIDLLSVVLASQMTRDGDIYYWEGYATAKFFREPIEGTPVDVPITLRYDEYDTTESTWEKILYVGAMLTGAILEAAAEGMWDELEERAFG